MMMFQEKTVAGKTKPVSRKRMSRSGLSLMEVMFAIGVLLIGIMGLAHVIPIGMHQSSDAVSADKTLVAMENLVSQTVLQSADAIDGGFLAPDRWSPSGASSSLHGFNNFQPADRDYRFGICIDPWFLSSSFTKRNRTTGSFVAMSKSTINGYDLGWFPCYDRGYNVLTSPAAPLYDNAGSRTLATTNFADPNLVPPFLPAYNRQAAPRFFRVASAETGLIRPSHAAEKSIAAQSAAPALIAPAEDKTIPAGRRFNLQAGVPVRSSEVGRYSAMSFIVSDSDDPETLRVSTAVLKNRIPMLDPGGSNGTQRFPSAPYAYSSRTDWTVPQGPYYEGERMGMVWSADYASFSSGLGGQIQLIMHRAVPANPQDAPDPPKFRSGQYIMLMRHVYSIRDVVQTTPTYANPDHLAFDWYRIADVVGDPLTSLEGKAAAVTHVDPVDGTTRSVWRVTLDLRGSAWVFDDSQRHGATGFVYTPGTIQDATYAVWMPDVVGVHERTVSLRGAK